MGTAEAEEIGEEGEEGGSVFLERVLVGLLEFLFEEGGDGGEGRQHEVGEQEC